MESLQLPNSSRDPIDLTLSNSGARETSSEFSVYHEIVKKGKGYFLSTRREMWKNSALEETQEINIYLLRNNLRR